MVSLQDLRDLAAHGNTPALEHILQQQHSFSPPCPSCTTPVAPSSDGKICCHHRIEHLADEATRANQLGTWCYLFDGHLSPLRKPIPWRSIQHVARRGDLAFATAFQERQPGWANTVAPLSVITGHAGTMTVVKLAIMRRRFDFVNFVVKECGCDIKAERSLVRMVVRLDIEDDECLQTLRFLFEREAVVKGTGAIEAARSVSRAAEIVQYLLAAEQRVGTGRLSDDHSEPP